jgi:hypothetical protein
VDGMSNSTNHSVSASRATSGDSCSRSRSFLGQARPLRQPNSPAVSKGWVHQRIGANNGRLSIQNAQAALHADPALRVTLLTLMTHVGPADPGSVHPDPSGA